MMQSAMDHAVLRGFTARIVSELAGRGLDPAITFEAQKSVLALGQVHDDAE
jgi:hypothetical protein